MFITLCNCTLKILLAPPTVLRHVLTTLYDNISHSPHFSSYLSGKVFGFLSPSLADITRMYSMPYTLNALFHSYLCLKQTPRIKTIKYSQAVSCHLTSCIRALCLKTFLAFIILTIAACKYIFRSSSTALLVCSSSCQTQDITGFTHLIAVTVQTRVWMHLWCYGGTCGVSFCIDVVILNFVLLLVKLIIRENVDSASISSWRERDNVT